MIFTGKPHTERTHIKWFPHAMTQLIVLCPSVTKTYKEEEGIHHRHRSWELLPTIDDRPTLMKKKTKHHQVGALTSLVNNIEMEKRIGASHLVSTLKRMMKGLKMVPSYKIHQIKTKLWFPKGRKVEHNSTGIYKVTFPKCENSHITKRLVSVRWGEHVIEAKTAMKNKRRSSARKWHHREQRAHSQGMQKQQKVRCTREILAILREPIIQYPSASANPPFHVCLLNAIKITPSN